MVSTKYEGTIYKPWKPVARPVSRSDISRSVMLNGPPTVAPKPGGKVFVYVYEAPDGRISEKVLSQSGYGTLPPNARLVFGSAPPVVANGQNVPFIYSNECVSDSNTTRRLRNRLKKSEKGYKVLADVDSERPRSSSRGGKMFMKQKKRMNNYTSPESSGQMPEHINDYYQERSKSSMGDERYTPWNMAKYSHAAIKYIPSSVLYNNKLNKPIKGEILPRLRSPPPEWRAKVESDFSLNNDSQTLPNRRWNTVDAFHRSHSSRCESAPPPMQMYINESGQDEDDATFYGNPVNGARSDSRGGIAAVNFDARANRVAPHRKQGIRTGRGFFTTTPHAQLDFNARAVGWSKGFAEHY